MPTLGTSFKGIFILSYNSPKNFLYTHYAILANFFSVLSSVATKICLNNKWIKINAHDRFKKNNVL